MDRIVYGISAINFQQSVNEIANENCAPNHFAAATTTTTPPSTACAAMEETSSSNVVDFNCLPPVPINHFQSLATSAAKACEPSAASDNEDELNSSAETVAADDLCGPSGATNFANRRKMPPRASKENSSLSRTKRRSILKPTKRLAKTSTDLSSLRPADIKKIYLNKKLTNFCPSKLETIFEEPVGGEADSVSSQVRFIGARKLKRSLSFCDGLNTKKTLIKQRRLKIKKTFGKRFALKKISLEDFLHRLNKSFDETEEGDDETETKETEATATSLSEAMDADDMDEVDMLGEGEEKLKTVSADLLLPTPDGGVLIKSNSFSGGCGGSKRVKADSNKVLR